MRAEEGASIMTNETNKFYDKLLQQLETLPVEELKEAYEPTTFDRPLNYIDRDQPIIIKLTENA